MVISRITGVGAVSLIICAPRSSGKTYLAIKFGLLDADDFLYSCGLPHGPAEDSERDASARRLVEYLRVNPERIAVTDLSPVLVAKYARTHGVAVVLAAPDARTHAVRAHSRRSGISPSHVNAARKAFTAAAAAIGRRAAPWEVLVAALRSAAPVVARTVLLNLTRLAATAVLL